MFIIIFLTVIKEIGCKLIVRGCARRLKNIVIPFYQTSTTAEMHCC